MLSVECYLPWQEVQEADYACVFQSTFTLSLKVKNE